MERHTMFRNDEGAHPICTIRRHPEGGFTPVLHLSGQRPPEASSHELSMPTPADVERYARNHYGTLVVLLSAECHTAA